MMMMMIIIIIQNSCNTVLCRDTVCVRGISINTLHKGDDNDDGDDDDDNNNNNNNISFLQVSCHVAHN